MAGKLTISTLNDDTGVLATQNGMRGVAKAWVNFNGRGTIAINGSFNVSSITDNGTGDYTVNFTTAMPNANYCALASGSASDTNSAFCVFDDRVFTTSTVRVATRNLSGARIDPFEVFVAIFSS